MDFIIVALFVWGTITVVGHVSWLIIAHIIRSILGSPPPNSTPPTIMSSPTPVGDLHLANALISRLTLGKIISAESYWAIRKLLEHHAKAISCWLPLSDIPPLPGDASEVSGDQEEIPVLEAVSSAPVATTTGTKVHALDRNYEEPTQPSPIANQALKNRAFGEMLQQFLQEKNIYWGELLSAVLIVGSAVGLILSLRSELSRIIPLFPAVLFLLITTAIHLAGFYTLKRWKLPSTSRGLLVIGSMLIPLTALATCLLIDHQGQASLFDPSFWALMLVGLGVFGALSYYSGIHLYPEKPALWVGAILSATLSQGLINRLAGGTSDPITLCVLSLCTLSGFAAVIVYWFWAPMLPLDEGETSEAEAGSLPKNFQKPFNALLRLVGTSGFSIAVAAGLLLFRSREGRENLAAFALPLSLLGALISGAGLYLQRFISQALPGAAPASTRERSGEMPWQVVIAQAIFVLGISATLLAFPLARSMPWICVAVAAANTIISLIYFSQYRNAILLFLSVVQSSIAFWMGSQLIAGNLSTGPLTPEAFSTAFFTPLTVLISLIYLALLAVYITREKVPVLSSSNPEDRVQATLLHRFGKQISGQEFTNFMAIALGIVLHALIAVGVSFQLGYVKGDAAGIMTASAMIFTLLSASFALNLRANSRVGMMVTVLLATLLVGLGLRGNTALAYFLGSNSWLPLWRVTACLTVLSVLVAAMRGLHAFLTAQQVPQIPQRRFRLSHLDSPGILTAASLFTGLTAAAICLRWDRPQELLWQAIVMFSTGITFTLLFWSQLRTQWSLLTTSLLVLGCTFTLAFGLNHWANIGAHPAQALAMSIQVMVLFGICALSARLYSRIRWIRPWHSSLAAALVFVAICYHHGFTIRHVPALTAAAHTLDGHIWLTSFVVALIAAVGMAVGRLREPFQWVSGVVATSSIVVWMALNPSPNPELEDVVHLLAMGPLCIALGFGIASATGTLLFKPATTTSPPKELSYEVFVTWASLWSLLLELGARHVHLAIRSLWWPQGEMERPLLFIWFGTILLVLLTQSTTRSAAVTTIRGFLLSLSAFLYFPILATRLSDRLDPHNDFPLWTVLIVGSVALHAAIVARLPLSKWPAAAFARANCLYPILVIVTTFAVGFAVTQTTAVPLQLLALTVFLARSALVTIPHRNECISSAQIPLRSAGVLLAAFFALILAWSNVQGVDLQELWAHRLVRMAAVLLGAAVILNWRKLRDADPHPIVSHVRSHMWSTFIAVSLATLTGAILLIRFELFHNPVDAAANYTFFSLSFSGPAPVFGPADITLYELVALFGATFASCYCLVQMTLKARWDLNASRPYPSSTYVYIAEAFTGLMILLVATTYPQLFGGFLREYWPFVVLGIALVAAVVSEALKRSGITAISQPLHSSALILPIAVGILAFFVNSETESDQLMLMIALFYFIMGAADGSRQVALIGGAFANMALLLFWNHFPGLDFTEHPQLWLIPPAASILLATHLERRRIPSEAVTWIRYIAMGTIFFSSSSEILLSGFGKELWPPMVLMVLSVLAVFAGIAMQIRSFLMFGVTFVFVSMIAMVAHAQQSLQHTWPWWALGIGLGLGILTLFGLFEKKRDEFKALAERLRNWEG
ncbi:MAG: hypothetical protein ACO1RA_15065 [Planctomycetaceae bacterium]